MTWHLLIIYHRLLTACIFYFSSEDSTKCSVFQLIKKLFERLWTDVNYIYIYILCLFIYHLLSFTKAHEVMTWVLIFVAGCKWHLLVIGINLILTIIYLYLQFVFQLMLVMTVLIFVGCSEQQLLYPYNVFNICYPLITAYFRWWWLWQY